MLRTDRRVLRVSSYVGTDVWSARSLLPMLDTSNLQPTLAIDLDTAKLDNVRDAILTLFLRLVDGRTVMFYNGLLHRYSKSINTDLVLNLHTLDLPIESAMLVVVVTENKIHHHGVFMLEL